MIREIGKMELFELFETIPKMKCRNSKLAGPKRSASQWMNWHKKTHTACPKKNIGDIINIGISHWTNRAKIHRWDFRTATTTMNRLHRESGENVQNVSLSNSSYGSMKTGGAQKRMLSFFVVGSFAADGNLLQPTVNANSKPHTSPVSRSQRALIMMGVTTLARVFVRVIPSMCLAPEWLSALLCSLPCFLSIFHFFFLKLDFYLCLFHVDVLGTRSPVHFAQWGVCCEPNFFDNYHHSETTEILIQEQSSDTMPSYLHDLEFDDHTIGRALSSPLITQEREEPTGRKQADHFFCKRGRRHKTGAVRCAQGWELFSMRSDLGPRRLCA